MFHLRLSFLSILLTMMSLSEASETHSKVMNPVWVISFDGLRNDKLDEYMASNANSNFSKFIQQGVRAEYMRSSFPSATFPNHWTIATGVYPAVHGVIYNRFYDPVYDMKVSLTRDFPINLENRWWNISEPVWQTAKNQNLTTGAYYWPGSEADGKHPSFYFPYDKSKPFNERVDGAVNWLKNEKFDLVFSYFHEPDVTGHKYGPYGSEYMNGISIADEVLGYVMSSVRANNLSHVNIIVLSDHGMEEVKEKVQVAENIDVNLVNLTRSVFNVISNVYPNDNVNKQDLFNSLSNLTHFKTYYKDKVPAYLNYYNNYRIAPIVVISDPGYLLTSDAEIDTDKGDHGYDPTLVQMKPIFMAQGPVFKKNKTIPWFENVNVQPLICGLLQLTCPPSNGSIAPFKEAFIDYGPTWNSSPSIRHNSFYQFLFIFLLCFLFY